MMLLMVNGKNSVIPADKSRTGILLTFDEKFFEELMATTDKWLAGEDVPEDAILANFVVPSHGTRFW